MSICKISNYQGHLQSMDLWSYCQPVFEGTFAKGQRSGWPFGENRLQYRQIRGGVGSRRPDNQKSHMGLKTGHQHSIWLGMDPDESRGTVRCSAAVRPGGAGNATLLSGCRPAFRKDHLPEVSVRKVLGLGMVSL